MPEKTAGNVFEIMTYIKGMSQLGLKAIDIHKEVGDIYGKDQMSFNTVYRLWLNLRVGCRKMLVALQQQRPNVTS